MEKKRNICIIDIKNVQKDYSYALEFIEIFENIQPEENYKKKIDLIQGIINNIDIRGGQVRAGISTVYYEKPFEKTEPKTHRVITERLADNLKKLTNAMFSSSKMMTVFMNREMLYHIRIHYDGNKDNLINLQYLVLLMQKLSFMFEGLTDPKKRLTVFIVPKSGDVYPFTDKDEDFDGQTYIDVSKYLYLLSNEYKGVIFGATMGKNSIIDVTALNYKITIQPEDYFPVILMDEDNYTGLFDEPVSKQVLKDVFSLAQNSRRRNFKEQLGTDFRDRFKDYVAESSFRKLEKTLDFKSEEKRKLLLDIYNILTERQYEVYEISFALFCFMFQKADWRTENIEWIEEQWKLVQDLFDGIKQIVQNAVQHSEKKSCVLSFYVHGDQRLQIQISDLNYQQTIIERFSETLKAEAAVCDDTISKNAMINLKNKKSEIYLCNLFGEFGKGDARDEWKQFRKLNSSAHVGLMLFHITAIRCNAQVKVHSSVSYAPEDLHECYSYRCENNKSRECEYEERNTRVIPGTQYTIEIPPIKITKNIPLGLGQIKNSSYVREDYETFAEYLDYKENELECATSFQNIAFTLSDKSYTTNAKEKLQVIKQWRLKWIEILSDPMAFSDNQLPYIDMQTIEEIGILTDTDDQEIFIKSFFEAIVNIQYPGKALVLLNADSKFMRVFKDMCIVFAARAFPKEFQLFVCADNYMDSLILCGSTFYEAIHNGYLLAIEHGTRELGVFEYSKARELYSKINNIDVQHIHQETVGIKVVPFDTILSSREKDKIFDERIAMMSDAEIDENAPGYRIKNTHMRLGSKVHIQSFYEMSFLFYRTSIANRIAFEILQNLLKGESFAGIDIKKDTLIFYGYASYSKAILTSLVEILKIYRKGGGDQKIAFISYQHNLQSESEEVQMYYGLPEKFPAQLENDKLIINEPVSVIQIVPISSTLTTFVKMWGRLKADVKDINVKNLNIKANYSVYWVMHTDKDTVEGKPSTLEQKYWKEYMPDKHLITTNFRDLNSEIYYFIKRAVIWHNPLSCEMCYPENLLDEVPLVETDQTSTVPTQQIRRRRFSKKRKVILQDNDTRLLKLKGSVVYGHIKRGKNHFQYYVDTQAYFYSVRDMVRQWLIDCRIRDEEAEPNVDFPCINVIFSPEHNTNVGFAQYVNTYYFNGLAEVVSINEDKEFRSNFECEHTALMHTIEHLLSHVKINEQKDIPVKFYFADDTIISGESFHKANSFLRTLLPTKYKKQYSSNLISKCFLLVDRMSDDTKRNYIANVERDFNAFLHIDVSNIRTQGDSCVGCKLEKDAIRLFKRSSTDCIAGYWSAKMTEFEAIPYDNKDKIKPYQTVQAFQRLLISHISQNIIFKDNDYFEYGTVYDSILAIAFKLLNCNVSELKKRVRISYNTLFNEVEGIESIPIFLKVISRPFFTFDFKVKLQVLTLLIALMEIMLGQEINRYECKSEISKIYKKFLLEKDRIGLTIQLGKLIATKLGKSRQTIFIQNCLFRCLTDMRSTYLLRRKTIGNIYRYLCEEDENGNGGSCKYEEFWHTYAYNIHYIVDCSSDEMRSLGLEYLLLTGKEYKEFCNDVGKNKTFKPLFLYESIAGKSMPDKNKRDTFYVFCHELLLQNTRIHFDGLEKDSQRHGGQEPYYMEQWSCARSLEQFEIYNMEGAAENESKLLPTNAERALYEYLKKENENTNSLQEAKNKYKDLLQKITLMIQQKHGISPEEIKIALLTLSQNNDKKVTISDLDILTEINAKKAGERYSVKNQVVELLKNSPEDRFNLFEDGYAISGDEELNPYIVIYFRNEEIKKPQNGKPLHSNAKTFAMENQVGRTMRTIAKVLLYISIKVDTKTKSFYYSRFILRDLLAYKNRLMRILETDFASDMFTKYAHTMDEKNIFAHEKAINHNSIRDNDELQMLLEKHNISEKYDMLEYNECIKWLSLKNYVNEQIARLFNRCFRMQSEELESENGRIRKEAPPLYIGEKESEYLSDNPFCRELNFFRELNFLRDDRFILLMDVVHIEYENLSSALIITRTEDGGGHKGYNQEYMKCIILDIFFSAIKSGSSRPGFLEKINWYRKEGKWICAKGMMDNEGYEELISGQCIVKIYREQCQNGIFDYLVFENNVMSIVPNFEDANRDIEKRLQDPLDYCDGHMSLLTIKKYIEGFMPELENKTIFAYEMIEKRLVFKTKLPILKKGDE